MTSASLNAWMNGELVGTWVVERGTHSFVYHASWKSSPRSRSLSLSLPITASGEARGETVASYFDNLLPDNESIRKRLARRFGTRQTTFSLLEAIGRDCVGAVQLLPENAEPQGWDRVSADPVDEDRIVALLRAGPATAGPDGDENDDLLRISLAGAQEKTALLWNDDGWCLPKVATPTTHILKLPLGVVGGSQRVNLSDSVQNEWLCAQLVSELGLPVAPVQMTTFGEQTVLVVERFDREWQQRQDGERWIARLPQEDLLPGARRAAVEEVRSARRAGHGRVPAPSRRQRRRHAGRADFPARATDVLAAGGHRRAREELLIFLHAGDSYGMTPLYDILSMWPYIGHGSHSFSLQKIRLAMALRAGNAHYRLDGIEARHWHRLAAENGGTRVWRAMLELIERVETALEAVAARLPAGFPEQLWETISRGMKSQAERFRRELRHLRVG